MSKFKIPTIRSTEPMTLTLSEQDRRGLAQLVQSGGYPVMLRMMEAHCIKQDIDLKQVDPADEKRVLAEHRVGIGMWNLFALIQKQIEREIGELYGENDEVEPTEEERMIARVVDPLSQV